MREAAGSIPLVGRLATIAAGYDGFILDLWGVLHDGVRPHPGAVNALRQLKLRGKRIVILSNGPRRASAVARRTAEIGIAAELYDGLHSSGEETWLLLKERRDPVVAGFGREVFLLVPAPDRGLLDGLDLVSVRSPAEAGFVLVTGLNDARETVADYERPLATAAELRRPMICANPDLEVVRDGVRELCAGALARRYEALGGPVHYVGKPHPAVYRRCLAWLGGMAASRILAVGDSLRTDVAGAVGAGIDSLLVTGGIHADELGSGGGLGPDPAKLAAACAGAGLWPTYAMPRFAW